MAKHTPPLSPFSFLPPSPPQRTSREAPFKIPFKVFAYVKAKEMKPKKTICQAQGSRSPEDGELKSVSVFVMSCSLKLGPRARNSSNQRCCECAPGKTIFPGALLTQKSPLHERQARSTASTSSSWLAWCLLAAATVTQVSGWSGLGGILPITATRVPRMSSRRSPMPAVGPSMQLRPPYIKVELTRRSLSRLFYCPRTAAMK